jgi:hypothetical protein
VVGVVNLYDLPSFRVQNYEGYFLVLVSADAISPVGMATTPSPIIKTKNVKNLPPVMRHQCTFLFAKG